MIHRRAAFAALPNGVTVRVGRRALTRARFELRNTDEVRSFLEKWRRRYLEDRFAAVPVRNRILPDPLTTRGPPT
jgi:hypothetical protein